MATLRSDITIDRPVEHVWSVVSDAGRISEWFPSVLTSSLAGNERHCQLEGGIPLQEEVVTDDGDLHRFRYRIIGGGVPAESHLGTMDVIALDDGRSLVLYSTEVERRRAGRRAGAGDSRRGPRAQAVLRVGVLTPVSQGRHDHRAARAGTGGRRRTPALGPRERLRRLLPAAAVALLLAGCGGAGGAGSAGQEVRAAEQVFVEDPVVEPDLSGTSATLRVVTDREMACAVVFGRDESLGDGIATDDDMGGGAHTDHAAVMRNLEPDTEYFYRVQGSGADGELYRSELRTFRTPPATAVASPGDNVALGARVVDVSSEFSDAYAAANAVDGNPNTEWSSAGEGDDASITLDLGRQVGVVGVALRSRSMSDGTSVIETFTVTVDDGQTLGPFDAGTTVTVHEVDVTGRVLRIDAERTTGGNTGLAEIEVYAAP